jgi:hypothetical protein
MTVYRARSWWLTPGILATREAEIRNNLKPASAGFKKKQIKKRLVEWFRG